MAKRAAPKKAAKKTVPKKAAKKTMPKIAKKANPQKKGGVKTKGGKKSTKRIIALFDVDMTLTPARSTVQPQMLKAL